jgi:hypothetical protein
MTHRILRDRIRRDMGLFDKKKKGRDDFDSPVEQIDLSAPEPASAAASEASSDTDEAETVDLASAPAPLRSGRRAPARPRSESDERSRPSPASYGIDDAVALMRTLPSENIELVVQVVKHTLESARIDISTIIQDATAKQERTESRIAVLRDAIAELEREIDTRRAEIAQLETENRETTRVRERLVLAEKLTQGARLDTVVDPQSSVAPRSAPPTRAKSPTPPPPVPSGSGNSNHVGSGNHAIPSPVGPGGPVLGSSPVGPGGPAGSYSQRQSGTHTVVSKK